VASWEVGWETDDVVQGKLKEPADGGGSKVFRLALLALEQIVRGKVAVCGTFPSPQLYPTRTLPASVPGPHKVVVSRTELAVSQVFFWGALGALCWALAFPIFGGRGYDPVFSGVTAWVLTMLAAPKICFPFCRPESMTEE
jgi:hypothetical protein